MGQKIRNDYVGTLTYSGSGSTAIVTMPASSTVPAWLTIGGQQYKQTTPLTIVPGSGLTVNRIYYVYAVRSGGNTILTFSLNDNTTWLSMVS